MTTTDITLIKDTVSFVKDRLQGDASGHDWWHIHRVWKTACTIAKKYPDCDHLVIELSALLHDIADWKDHDGDFEVGPAVAAEWLDGRVTEGQKETISHIIRHISFKGAAVEQVALPLEGQIVQDADRMDAIGAIGIARTFAFGGTRGNRMYDPESTAMVNAAQEAYVANTTKGTTIDHFYEKLLLLKDRMNTEAGKQMAAERHLFMQEYLERFYSEWAGEK